MDSVSVDPTIRENILRLARKLPTAPHIFGRLGGLLNDMNADLDQIVRLVAVDSGLTSRVIRLSNSVYFRGDLPVRSLEEAISRIGFREMHRIMGVAITDQIFQGGMPIYNLSAVGVWENSVTTALAMEILARDAGEDQSAAYTVGLLRPVGKLVIDTLLQMEQPGLACPETDALDLPKWERAWAGITSNEAAAMILGEWKMPDPVCLGVLHHYRPSAGEGTPGAMLHLASWVATQMGKGIAVEANQWEVSDEILELAGLNKGQVEASVAETQESFDELRKRLRPA